MCSLRMYFARITGLEYTTTVMTFPYLRSTSFRLSLSALALSFLAGCAGAPAGSRPSGRTSDAAVTLSVEESADALRLAQESRLELQTQSARLKELEGQMRDLTEILSWSAEQIKAQNLLIDSLVRGT